MIHCAIGCKSIAFVRSKNKKSNNEAARLIVFSPKLSKRYFTGNKSVKMMDLGKIKEKLQG